MRRNGISAPSRLGGQLLILYDYNRAGNLTDRDNSLHSAFNEDYTYDDLDRLTDADRADTFDQSWTLDAAGNFSEFDDDGTSQTREVNEANEIESISGGWITPEYDAAGNMISGPMAGDGATRLHYEYDAWNRLVEVRDDDGGEPDDLIAEYEYDAVNRRIEKVVAGGAHVHYYYDGWQLVDEESVDGQGATVARNEYVWSLRYIDAPIVRFHDANGDGDVLDQGDNTRYYTSDANHNVTAAFDLGSGAVDERYVYTPYGQVTVYSPTWTTPAAATTDGPLFAGYFYDAETALYQVRHRYYHAELGAFVSRDPIGYDAGDGNLYRYVGGNPILGIDPSGLADSACDDIPSMRAYNPTFWQRIDDWFYDVWNNDYIDPETGGGAAPFDDIPKSVVRRAIHDQVKPIGGGVKDGVAFWVVDIPLLVFDNSIGLCRSGGYDKAVDANMRRWATAYGGFESLSQWSSMPDYMQARATSRTAACAVTSVGTPIVAAKGMAALRGLRSVPGAPSGTFQRVFTGGLRNEAALSAEQMAQARAIAIQYGATDDMIRFSNSMNTGYANLWGEEVLYIGSDVLPAARPGLGGMAANSRLTMRSALAHELYGHRAVNLAGGSRSVGGNISVLNNAIEEAEASIRAARLAPGLTSTERYTLLRDGVSRLRAQNLRVNQVRGKMAIGAD